MALCVGCDIVSINVFKERLNESGDLVPDRLFHPGERSGASMERLAGLFAAKEAAIKALGIPAGNWQQLYIDHKASGAPILRIVEAQPQVREISLSISHCDDYAFAVVAAVLE